MRLLVNYLFLVFFLGFLLLNKAYSNETTLKSAYKINKKEKVEYVKSNNTAYWQFMQLKFNDLRGDGTVYYLFDLDRYYRVNSNFEVVSKGTYKYKGDTIFELRDNEKSLISQLEHAKDIWEKELKANKETVSEENVADVVSVMTGIPVNRVISKERKKLSLMSNQIKKKIIGQDEAVEKIVKAIQRNRVGLKDPNKPIGSFIFLGATGVGKT